MANDIYEGVMLERIGTPAMLEQLAEECTEMAKEALKLARIIRGENPTPVTYSEARAHLEEEFTDVIQCSSELELKYDISQMNAKSERFMDRWEAKQNGKYGDHAS
jgi:NTP pyrophosphatase (non-canonical NTP hydrolase)